MGTATDKAGKKQRSTLWRFAPLALILLTLAAIYALGWHRYLSLSSLARSHEMLEADVVAHPFLAAAAFLLIYTAAVAASVPAASLLTIAGGFLFGWLLGGMLVLIAATAGATLLFLAARTAFGGYLRRRAGGRLSQLADGFRDGAFGYLLVLRLAPIFPFWMVNIAPAFFDVSLRVYIAATALGILPATFAYAYLGRGLETALAAAAASGRDLTLADLLTPQLTIAFLALAVVAAIPLVVKKLRAAQIS